MRRKKKSVNQPLTAKDSDSTTHPLPLRGWELDVLTGPHKLALGGGPGKVVIQNTPETEAVNHCDLTNDKNTQEVHTHTCTHTPKKIKKINRTKNMCNILAVVQG